jgi:hypothetical protein
MPQLASDRRNRRFNMMLSSREEQMLRAVAKADRTTASDAVRRLIHRRAAERTSPPLAKRFPIGSWFLCSGKRWYVTDVGTRVVVAVEYRRGTMTDAKFHAAVN